MTAGPAGRVQGPAPLLGEQTVESLSECGYAPDAIKELVDGKVVEVPAEVWRPA